MGRDSRIIVCNGFIGTFVDVMGFYIMIILASAEEGVKTVMKTLLSHSQMERGQRRLEGAETLLSLVSKEYFIPSVRYSILCGWQGLLSTHTQAQ